MKKLFSKKISKTQKKNVPCAINKTQKKILLNIFFSFEM